MKDSGLSNSGFFKSQKIFRSHCEKYNEFIEKENEKEKSKEKKEEKSFLKKLFNFLHKY